MMLLMLVILGISTMWGNCEVMKGKKFTCTEFFHKGKEPSGLQPNNNARICQMYNNKVHFATLYDSDNRIPIYSAYKYHKTYDKDIKRHDNYEPQLEYPRSEKKNMADMPKEPSKDLKESQAVTEDYIKDNMKIGSKQYNRGHLSPILHHNDDDSKQATLTLTNIVPQFEELNGGQWNEYEIKKMKEFTEECKTTYVIVGVIPGKRFNRIKRVNVPSHIWTAACCVNANDIPVKSLAYIAKNDKNEVETICLHDLQQKLGEASGRAVTLFNGGCQRNRNLLSQIF